MDFQLNDLMIDDLARRIASRMADDALWDSADVAAYLRVTERYASEFYAALPSFPRAIRPPAREGRGRPRWEAKEVKAWAKKFKDSAGAGRPRKPLKATVEP